MVRAIFPILKLRLQWELSFRADAIFGVLGSFLGAIGGILLFEVVYGQVSTIGGWERPAALGLVGTLVLLLELERGVFRGIQRLPALVERGRLEHYLLRPVAAPILIAFSRADPRLIWRLPVGVAVIAYAASLAPPTFARIAMYVLSLVMSLGIYVLLVFCLACASFWVGEVSNLYWLVYDLTEFARYPASVYQKALRTLFFTVLPLLMLTNFPVELLLRGASPVLLLYQFAVLFGFWLLGWGLWRRGLRRYQGAST